VGWLDSLRSAFSFLGTPSRIEGVVAQYIIREHHRGRSLAEILDDPYVVNRATREQLDRILERPDVLHALGEDIVSQARAER
jgi:hypothetical protein